MIFFFKQKTAYEMRISDWSSDVCSSDLRVGGIAARREAPLGLDRDVGRIGAARQLSDMDTAIAVRGDDPLGGRLLLAGPPRRRERCRIGDALQLTPVEIQRADVDRERRRPDQHRQSEGGQYADAAAGVVAKGG